MNKKLFKQIRNEWHCNLWLLTELLLISVVLWYIVDFIYIQTWTYIQPLGFDLSHCYKLEMNQVTIDNPSYKFNDSIPTNDIKMIMNNLRKLPDIEAACLSYNTIPYEGSGTIKLFYGKYNTTAIIRHITPDYFRVFRCTGANGETPEQLSRMFKDKSIMISDNAFEGKAPFKTKDLIGKTIRLEIMQYSSFEKLAGVYKPIRPSEFTSPQSSVSIMGMLSEKEYSSPMDLTVRVKPEQDNGFIKRLWKDIDKINAGNVFISTITPMGSYRYSELRSAFININYIAFFAGFLLLNIFLIIFGTFCYRTQQRRSEIAIFKALGANNRNIFMREISESIILLSIATIPAIIIDWNLAFAKLNTSIDGEFLTAGRFITTIFITWLLIAIILVSGSLFPACKAMKVQPAVALHED